MYLTNISYGSGGMPVVLSMPRQNWREQEADSFHGRRIELDAGEMHYLDEGSGEVVLFVHGLPTWSYLYRRFIAGLMDRYRCIAIDHLGFGLSDKPADFRGLPEDHTQNLVEFIEKMDLEDITLVVHDFGGPIGLAAAIQRPERIRRIVAMNTWLWATDDIPAVRKAGRVLNSGLGRFLYTRMNFSPRYLLPKGFHNRSKLTVEMRGQYMRPFPDPASRHHLYELAKSLLNASDWYERQFASIDRLAVKPWLLLWGMKDRFITPVFLEKWMKTLPGAEAVELDCGHFVQEECPEEAIEAIRYFINKTKNHE